jgi:hypothetical protein
MRQSEVEANLCILLEAVNPLASAHFLHGAPGSRAHSACLAVISAALCWNQREDEHCEWEGADAAAWELVLGRVLPRLRDLQGAAQLLAMGGVKDKQQQQQQSGLLVQYGEHTDSGEGGRHSSCTTCAYGPTGSNPTAADSGGDVAQADVRSDVCPPADLALLMLMAAARTVKAGVGFHCFGSSCCNCGFWHPRGPAGDCVGSDNRDEGEGVSSSTEGGEHDQHKEQPNSSCDGCSMAGQANQSTGHGQGLSPGLKDLDQLEEALDILLTLVHCLVVRGAWWQQAVSQHPLLLLQVLMTVTDVSLWHQAMHTHDHLLPTYTSLTPDSLSASFHRPSDHCASQSSTPAGTL